MMEFVGGSGIYVHPDIFLNLMSKLKSKMKSGSKPPGPYIASELLSMFYDDQVYPTLAYDDRVDQKVVNAIVSEYICSITNICLIVVSHRLHISEFLWYEC